MSQSSEPIFTFCGSDCIQLSFAVYANALDGTPSSQTTASLFSLLASMLTSSSILRSSQYGISTLVNSELKTACCA